MQLLIFSIFALCTNLPICSIFFSTICLLRNHMPRFSHLVFPPTTVGFFWALFKPRCPLRVVGSNGLGPSTSRLSGVCSNQLSYEPMYGGGNRVRTDDPLLAGQVLYQLSYTPILLKKMPPLKVACSLLKTNKKETIEFPID